MRTLRATTTRATLPYFTMPIASRLLIGSCILFLLTVPCQGWLEIGTPHLHASVSRSYSFASTATTRAPSIGIRTPVGTIRSRLEASSSPLKEENDEDDSAGDTPSSPSSRDSQPRLYRAAFSGVSVSFQGFWVILRVGPDQYWPVQVTSACQDRTAATSPDALTLLQLLAGVDMAGAILPPDILARIIIGVCEDEDEDEDEQADTGGSKQRIRDLVRRTSNWPDQAPVDTAYLELPEWWQSRIRLPICTVDAIQFQAVTASDTEKGRDVGTSSGTWEYQCQVQDVGPYTVTPPCTVLQRVAWSDPAEQPEATDAADPDKASCCFAQTSAAFFALALALRYQAPVLLSLADAHSLFSQEQVVEKFPLYRSRDKLQERSASVTANIERGFEIHKLQAALQIAIRKQDMKAAAKIRVRLDEMDSLQDLPVQPETDTQNMQ